jgi:hypothetical protein
MIVQFLNIQHLELYSEYLNLDFNDCVKEKYGDCLQIIKSTNEAFLKKKIVLIDIEYIPTYYFRNVQTAEKVILGNNVRVLGNGSFQNTNIKQLIFNKNLRNIGIGVFWGSRDIKFYNLSENVTYCNEIKITRETDISFLDNIYIKETQKLLNNLIHNNETND